ncbi:MAG: hypothetical protein L6Q99_12550 [Planctomycetes bacterium]|nr:hypothetical protein [Planctomycetota bacterium]
MSAPQRESRELSSAEADRALATTAGVRAEVPERARTFERSEIHERSGAPDCTWVLDGEALTLETRDGSRERIELGELAELRLVRASTRADCDRFECRLRTRDGRKRAFASRAEHGRATRVTRVTRATGAAARSEYTTFVRALIGALVVRAPQCRFRAVASDRTLGFDLGRVWFWLVLLVVVLLTLAAVGAPSAWTKLGFVLALLSVAVLWTTLDRPREFDPRRIPGDALPGG